MRNHLWLLSAFTVAATLTLAVTDADAATKKSKKIPAVAKVVRAKHTAYDPIGAYAINTQNCPAIAPSVSKNWGWKNATLTALFIKQGDGSYQENILPGATNPDEQLPIASIAKLMSALVVFDAVDQHKLDLDDEIAVTKESLCLGDNRFAVIGLPAGITKIKGSDALTQMIKLSSNTMAVNLAIATAGSVENFVDLMNAKAKSWGMNKTKFKRPDGLPEGDRKQEYTTARDMLIMAEHILPQMERFKKYSNAPMGTWTLAENPKLHPDKAKLADMGALFKTGTIAQCSSLLTIAEQGENKMADIQLCGKSATRFQNALASVRTVFKRVGEMVMSPAMAADTSSKATPVALSSRQVQPSDP